MTQHYPKGTISIRKWCNTCGRETEHSVSDGRVGRCVQDHHPPSQPKPAKPAKVEQGGLFP